MAFLEKIRHWLRVFFLRRALKACQRQRKLIPYDRARSFVLLSEPSGDKAAPFLRQLTQDLQRDGKTVMVVVCSRQKEPPDLTDSGPSFIPGSKRSFAWNMRPKDKALKQMAGQTVDVLVDLSPIDAHHLKALAALCNASYKVGMAHPHHTEIFDLMLEVNSTCNPETLARHAFHYLRILKTPPSP